MAVIFKITDIGRLLTNLNAITHSVVDLVDLVVELGDDNQSSDDCSQTAKWGDTYDHFCFLHIYALLNARKNEEPGSIQVYIYTLGRKGAFLFPV